MSLYMLHGVSNAPGGTGKTFLLNTLLAEIRSHEDIAIACAFVGVAAVLLEGGTTVHKRFNICINGVNTSVTYYVITYATHYIHNDTIFRNTVTVEQVQVKVEKRDGWYYP